MDLHLQVKQNIIYKPFHMYIFLLDKKLFKVMFRIEHSLKTPLSLILKHNGDEDINETPCTSIFYLVLSLANVLFLDALL